MSNVGFRIFKKSHRPERALVEQFKGLPVSNISDEMNRLGCMSARIKPYGSTPLAGVALTVREQLGDLLMVHKAISIAQPGDVIVVDGLQGDLVNALAGEMMSLWAKAKGIAGFVIDGAIRDVDAISRLGFPVYAAGVSPKGPYKDGWGEINAPISCGGVVVNPGDIVVGDDDGIVIVPPRDAPAILARAKAKFDRETAIRAEIAEGRWDPSLTDEALQQKGCEIIDDYYSQA